MLMHDYDTSVYNTEAMQHEWLELFNQGLKRGYSIEDSALDATMHIDVYKDQFKLNDKDTFPAA